MKTDDYLSITAWAERKIRNHEDMIALLREDGDSDGHIYYHERDITILRDIIAQQKGAEPLAYVWPERDCRFDACYTPSASPEVFPIYRYPPKVDSRRKTLLDERDKLEALGKRVLLGNQLERRLSDIERELATICSECGR